MKKNVIKTAVAAICVVAASMGGTAYNVANQPQIDMLLAENVETLSKYDSASDSWDQYVAKNVSESDGAEPYGTQSNGAQQYGDGENGCAASECPKTNGNYDCFVPKTDEIIGKVEDLSGQTVVIQNPDQALYPMYRIGDIVISLNRYDDRSYYGSVYKNKELGEPKLLFRTGNGHNEFSNITFGKKSNNALLLMDGRISPKSLTIVPLTDCLKNISDVSTWKRYSFKDNPSLVLKSFNYYSMSDSTLLVSGHAPDSHNSIMSIFDYKNDRVTPLSFWPEDGIDVPDLVKQRIYTEYASLFGNGKGRYLYQSGIARYAFIFTIKDKKVNVIKNIYSSYPKYTTKDGLNYRLFRGSGVGKYNIAANDKYIYCLLRDYDIKGEKMDHGPEGYGNIVEVFDWNGNKVKTIHLDHLGSDIMLSDDGKKLIAFFVDFISGDEPKRYMWEYDL